MARDVQNWMWENPHLQSVQTPNKNREPLTPIYNGEPFESVAMNIIRPLSRIARENRYILDVVDHFTNHADTDALNK